MSDELGLETSDDIKTSQSTITLSAYELYLKARSLFLARDNVDKADEYLIKAIKLDEKYVKA